MKRQERDLARILRSQGLSINEIVKKLKVSKGSVSVWVRHIELSDKQKSRLTAKGFSVSAIEKRRVNRIANTQSRHQVVIDRAKGMIGTLTERELLLIGAALYWGEGNKANKNVAGIANSDPALIQIMMKFFREVCNVNEEKFRGHVHTFSHLNVKKAEKYWSSVSNIPLKQFYKTYAKPSVAGLGKKDSLPYGTFQIYICDTNVALSIRGWVEKLRELSVDIDKR